MAVDTSKQYLISFIASMQGDKLTIAQLKKIERQVQKTTKEVDGSAKAGGRWDQSMMNVAKRALTVAPVWLLLRGAIMLVTSAIRETIQANIAFQEQMARIRTVVTASSNTVESDMTRIRSAILGMATGSKLSLKELTEGFYFLRTAGLSTEEALGAFESTVATSIGTMNSMKDTTRIVVGIYNTMGKYMDENLTVAEKFTKINDILTYTYSTQEVQLQELGQSYLQLAPYISGLETNIVELITMLGFLNTKMLKSGKAGRMTGMAMIQLMKNSKQLAEVFGVVFDPTAPLNFLDVLRQIRKTMGDSVKITTEQSEAISKVFQVRAGVAIRLLLDHLKELEETLIAAEKGAKGFAETMKEIMEHTTTAQMQRFKNILAVTVNEFFSAASGSGDFVQALKDINYALETYSIPKFRELGMLIGYIGSEIARSIIWLVDWGNQWDETKGIIEGMIKPVFTSPPAPKFKSYSEYRKEQEKQRKETEKTGKLREDIVKLEEEYQKLNLSRAKDEKENERHLIELMKLRGATEIEIAKKRTELFEESELMLKNEDELATVMNLRNNLLEAELKLRTQITDVFQKAQLNMLKAQGYTELQIIVAQERQLELNRHNISDGKYMLTLADLRLNKALELQKIQEGEARTREDLIKKYKTADAGERKRISRLFELLKRSPNALAEDYTAIIGRGAEYELKQFNRKVIDEYWSYFSKEQKRAIANRIAIEEGISHKIQFYREPEETKDMEDLLFQTDDIEEYWNQWGIFGQKEVIAFADFYKQHMLTLAETEERLKVLKEAEKPLEIKHDVNISVTPSMMDLHKKSSDAITQIADEVAKAIRENPAVKEAIENRIAEY
jgi:TP901 family phage tail tape measure protein